MPIHLLFRQGFLASMIKAESMTNLRTSKSSSLRTRLALLLSMALIISACSSSEADTESQSVVEQTTTTVEELTESVETTEDSAVDSAETESTDDAADDPASDSNDDPAAETEEPAPETTAVPEDEPAEEVPDADPEVPTDVVADAQGGRALFDGTVDEVADLEDLVADAWGDGDLGLHRGHAQVENVLEGFLGIDHDEMHDYMDDGFNLAAISEALDKDPDALVDSLTNSYVPFVEEGVVNGVISEDELAEWVELLRVEFTDRVFWDGVSES